MTNKSVEPNDTTLVIGLGNPAPEPPERALVVGLGNPGRKYAGHRHNVGFMAVAGMAKAHGIALNRSRTGAIYGDGRVAGAPVILARPMTYMNESGRAVGALLRYFRVERHRLMVVYDELDLPLGTLRLRPHGGAGGHNGMRSIIQHIGQEFPRLRLGIGRPPGRMPAAAFVLRDFDRQERDVVDAMLQEAVAAIETFLREGIDMAMTRHNGTVAEDSSTP